MEAFLFTIIGVSLFFSIVGFVVTKINQEKSGIYYIGGPNGFGASKFFRNHPHANNIFNKLDSIMSNRGMTNADMQDLINSGCKIVARGRESGYAMVITSEMCLLYGQPMYNNNPTNGTTGQVFDVSNKETISRAIIYKKYEVPIGSYEIEKKQKSVVKNAIGGAVIAGGVGAVVGAINAASKNASSDKVETKIVYGESQYGYWAMNFECGKYVPIKDMLASAEYKDYDISDIQGLLKNI